MKLQLFNGGLSTRLAPNLIQPNQGVQYSNIDVTKGTLSPVKDKASTSITTDKYAVFYDAGNEWVSSDVETDFVEFQGRLYATDGVQPTKRFNGVTENLGIVKPYFPPVLESLDSADIVDEFTIESKIATGGDLPYSDLQYMIVNISNNTKAAPYEFTVYGGSTTSARAQGALLTLDERGFYGKDIFFGSPITTLIGSNRAIEFSEFKGNIGDSCTLYRYYNKVWREVGTITSFSSTIVDDTEDISANNELDLDTFSAFNGTYQYVYTYYNSNDGTESAPSSLSNELEVNSGTIRIQNLYESTDPQVTNMRVYRVGANLTQFTLVETLPNVTTPYIDILKDSEVSGELLESDNYYEAPSNLRYLSESYAMLFGAVDSTLRFTPIGKPNAWPPEFSIEFDSPITGLGSAANGLLVFTRTSSHIVTGTGPTSLAQQPLRGDQGCIAHSSIQEVTEGMLCWASTDGLCVSSGNNVQVITKNTLGKVELDPVSSAVVDEVYYCLESTGSTLVWDFRFEPIFYRLELGVEQFAVASSELYGWLGGSQYLMFGSDSNLSYSFKSAEFTEGARTKEKCYKKFYFSHKGDIIINISINDSVVTTKALTGNDTTEVSVPQASQRGFTVQFDVSGTGELLEVEYTASVNRNG